MQETGIHAGRTSPPAGPRRPLSRRSPAPGGVRAARPARAARSRGWHRGVAAGLALVGACAALLAGGCANEPTTEEVGALTPDAFVDVIVALREAERAAVAEDSAHLVFQARKEEILAEHDVTEEDVRDFVRLHEGDFALMDRLWDTIAQRLKYVPEADDPTPDLRIERRR